MYVKLLLIAGPPSLNQNMKAHTAEELQLRSHTLHSIGSKRCFPLIVLNEFEVLCALLVQPFIHPVYQVCSKKHSVRAE